MLRRTVLAALPVALAGLRIAPVAIAQDKAADYPSKMVTILVPYAAGGTSDMFARLLADELDKASASASSSRTSPARAATSARRSSRRRPPTATRSASARSPPTPSIP